MNVTVKDINGQDQAELEVGFALVDKDKGNQAVHDVVVAYQAAQRSGTAFTKTMGDVAGSGSKPWRQKGTGRARASSRSSPIWRGGGVVFGPRGRDFTKKVSRKTRHLAMRKALSERLRAGDVHVVEDLKLETPKTKGFLSVRANLALNGTLLVVVSEVQPNLSLATRNLSEVELTTHQDLNTYQVLRSDKLLFTRAAFEKMAERLQD